MRIFGLCIWVCCVFSLSGNANGFEELSIRVLSPLKSRSVQVIPENGEYALVTDGIQGVTVKKGSRITFQVNGTQVKVSLPEKNLGSYREAKLVAKDSNGYFRLYCLNPQRAERVYDDHLILTASSGELKLINRVTTEKYVAGVVEAETGKDQSLEFYKVQAIISRTYALNNRRRYYRQGYNLSDGVDCQVYHGKCRWEPDILTAVQLTTGKVLVDSEMRLITAAFHSNSGGETVSSETVWTGMLPYLGPRKDDFSLNGDHSNWTRTVSREGWLTYLTQKHKLPVDDKLVATMAQNYQQINRQVYFIDPDFNILLKDIRKDWNLNSTFFNVAPVGLDSLQIKGKGFGHGAGLSQEGAMRMADLGFEYTDILHFYYDDVHVIDLKALDFFRMD